MISFARKKWLKAVLFLLAVFVVWFAYLVIGAWYTLSNPAKYGSVILIFVGFLMYPAIQKLVDWLDGRIGSAIEKNVRRAKSARRGFLGENEVGKWLSAILDPEQYSILPNVVLPGCRADIDLVVVGPRGVLAIEVKNYSTERYFENDEFFEKKDGKKTLLSPDQDPRIAVRRYAYSLMAYLSSNGFGDVEVKKVLVFSNGLVSWDGNTNVYIVRDEASMREYFDRLEIDSYCTPEICKQIKQLLEKE